MSYGAPRYPPVSPKNFKKISKKTINNLQENQRIKKNLKKSGKNQKNHVCNQKIKKDKKITDRLF